MINPHHLTYNLYSYEVMLGFKSRQLIKLEKKQHKYDLRKNVDIPEITQVS